MLGTTISWKLLLAALSVAAVMATAAALVAVPDAFSHTKGNHGQQSHQHPNPPTGSNPGTMAIGNKEVALSWAEPASNMCTIYDYLLEVVGAEHNNQVYSVFTPDTTHTVTQNLEPNTWYKALVYSYSSFNSCNDYSANPLLLMFRTNASNGANDPVAPPGQKLPGPNPPTNLTKSVSGNQVTLNWAHATNTGRCQHTYYRYTLHNVTDDTTNFVKLPDTPMATSLTLTVESVKQYALYLYSYSNHEDCNESSDDVSVAALIWF